MARKPRVYAAEIDGLHDWIVAAPNQKAALEAFGVHQDLFAQGRARLTDEPKAVAAAQKAPGAPLRRPKGSKADFAPATGEGGAGAWSKAAGARRGGKAKAKPKPDRRALERAEKALSDHEARTNEALGALDDEIEALKARREDLAEKSREDRRGLKRAVETERRALARQG